MEVPNSVKQTYAFLCLMLEDASMSDQSHDVYSSADWLQKQSGSMDDIICTESPVE